jgi:hypothetical protein
MGRPDPYQDARDTVDAIARHIEDGDRDPAVRAAREAISRAQQTGSDHDADEAANAIDDLLRLVQDAMGYDLDAR